MHLPDIIVLIVVGIGIIGALTYILRKNKNGCNGCCGSCSSCGSCSKGKPKK